MNPYIPTNFRSYCGDNQRLQYADLDTYLLLYPPIEQQALMNNIRAARWGLGYVPGVHDLFLSSGVGIECVNVLADKMIPSKVSIGGKDPEINTINELFEKSLTKRIKKLVKQTIRFGSALGRICFNSISQNAYIDSIPLGRFTVIVDESERVIESTCYLESKKATENEYSRYVLIEKRYFKDNKPYSYYGVIKMMFNSMLPSKENLKTVEYTKKNLSQDDLRFLQSIYPDYPLYKDVELPFDAHLGVELFNYTEDNAKYPNCWFGEAMLADVGDSLYAYDHAFTAKENDKYLGRGRALIPLQQQSQDAVNEKRTAVQQSSFLSLGGIGEAPRIAKRRAVELDKTFYDQVAGFNGEALKPTSVQFNLRTMEWREELNGALGDIA